MATKLQRSRQERAMNVVQRRLDFWESVLDQDEVEVDGKVYNPEEQWHKANTEAQNLEAKGIRHG